MTDKKLYHEAAQTALNNTMEIFEESSLLHDHRKYPRAFALCMLSLEELTKSFVYRCISTGLLDEKGIRKILVNHPEKITHSGHLMAFAIMFVNHSDELTKAIDHDKKIKDHDKHIYPSILSIKGLESAEQVIETLQNAHPKKLDAIYVDVRENNIINPKKIIDKKICDKVFSNAGIVLGFMNFFISKSTDEQFVKYTNYFLKDILKDIKMEVAKGTKSKQ